MSRFLPFLMLLTLPMVAVAQSYSSAPIVIIGEGATEVVPSPVPGAGLPNFPENAVTRVGENSGGTHYDDPANPPAPASPPDPAAPAAAPAAPAPASPVPPASPVNKLWPRDTVQIFLPACAQARPLMIAPCTCVITRLMVEMPHDEFLTKSEDGTIEQDARLHRIRTECATMPQQRKD